MSLKQKYGSTALIAGASEGIGAAFAERLAEEGMDLILIARREEPLLELAQALQVKHNIQVDYFSCDLATPEAAQTLFEAFQNRKIDFIVYNAAISYIGPFESQEPEKYTQLANANMVTPMNLIRLFAPAMLTRQKGGIVLMASLAGFQGSGFLAGYAASKAFDRVLAESLWYEWKDRGVDIMACCAGATSTPNYLNTKPEKTSFFAPKVQTPAEVVADCMKQLGKRPSYITGMGNRIASFFMQRLMPRKMAIKIMGDTTRKMYRL